MATGNSQAMYYLDGQAFGGAIQPNKDGFTWKLVAIFREAQTDRKTVISEVTVETLDGDSLLQIRDKLAAGIKAEGLARDFNVTTVAFFPLNVIAV
jgi:hypothetical protein